MMKYINTFILFLCTWLPVKTVLASDANPSQPVVDNQTLTRVLESMEYLRGFKDTGFSFSSEVITVNKEKVVGKHLLDVKISDKGYALIEIMEPLNEKGRRTLIRERDLWLYLPNSSNIIRIAPLQRVFGSASIADVLNTSFLHDYIVESQHLGENNQLMLSLRSKERHSTYARIDLHYDLVGDKPIETKHFTASGRLLKTIKYKTFRGYNGKKKLEKIAIYDSLRKDSVVWIKMEDYRISDLSSALFTKSGLKKR